MPIGSRLPSTSTCRARRRRPCLPWARPVNFADEGTPPRSLPGRVTRASPGGPRGLETDCRPGRCEASPEHRQPLRGSPESPAAGFAPLPRAPPEAASGCLNPTWRELPLSAPRLCADALYPGSRPVPAPVQLHVSKTCRAPFGLRSRPSRMARVSVFLSFLGDSRCLFSSAQDVCATRACKGRMLAIQAETGDHALLKRFPKIV